MEGLRDLSLRDKVVGLREVSLRDGRIYREANEA